MSEPRLFNPLETEPKRCRSCDATQRERCTHDNAYRDTPLRERPKRPRGCIAGHDPSTTPIPY